MAFELTHAINLAVVSLTVLSLLICTASAASNGTFSKPPITSTTSTSNPSPTIMHVPAAAPRAHSGGNEVFAFMVAGLVGGLAFGL
ncbi:hypothetical protein QTJ16_000789 [Diplocarpon rosae]|uniref:Transmembrane protein n=1 Tax=Diplocarpon rosae TaxID=946125 RepID=A0AAD9T724_9HELO|nr:hypothetical protein QTJ16_000789 [Diplocarpon rosae]